MGIIVIPASVNRNSCFCCASKNIVKFQKESAMPSYLLFKRFILHESKQFCLLIIVGKKVMFSSPVSSSCSDLSEFQKKNKTLHALIPMVSQKESFWRIGHLFASNLSDLFEGCLTSYSAA